MVSDEDDRSDVVGDEPGQEDLEDVVREDEGE